MILYSVMLILVVYVGIAVVYLMKSKNRWDNLLSLNVLSTKIYMIILIFSLVTQRYYYLDILLIYITLSYIGLKLFSEMMIRRSKS